MFYILCGIVFRFNCLIRILMPQPLYQSSSMQYYGYGIRFGYFMILVHVQLRSVLFYPFYSLKDGTIERGQASGKEGERPSSWLVVWVSLTIFIEIRRRFGMKFIYGLLKLWLLTSISKKFICAFDLWFKRICFLAEQFFFVCGNNNGTKLDVNHSNGVVQTKICT